MLYTIYMAFDGLRSCRGMGDLGAGFVTSIVALQDPRGRLLHVSNIRLISYLLSDIHPPQ